MTNVLVQNWYIKIVNNEQGKKCVLLSSEQEEKDGKKSRVEREYNRNEVLECLKTLDYMKRIKVLIELLKMLIILARCSENDE